MPKCLKRIPRKYILCQHEFTYTLAYVNNILFEIRIAIKLVMVNCKQRQFWFFIFLTVVNLGLTKIIFIKHSNEPIGIFNFCEMI